MFDLCMRHVDSVGAPVLLCHGDWQVAERPTMVGRLNYYFAK